MGAAPSKKAEKIASGVPTDKVPVEQGSSQPSVRDIGSLSRSEAYDFSNRYKAGSFTRIGYKVGIAGVLGTVFSPVICTGPIPAVAVVGAVNSAAFIAFYDITREAITSATLTDSPVVSAFSGGLAGALQRPQLLHQGPIPQRARQPPHPC